MPCQDFGAFRKLGEGLLLGAVADGAGSSSQAHRGARHAVRAAIKRLARDLRTRDADGGRNRNRPNERELGALLRAAFADARADLDRLARQQGVPRGDFACTLIAFVASPDWLGAAQLGDGLLVSRAEGGGYQLLFRPDKGEYANETVFLTDRDGLDRVRVRSVQEPQSFVCVATDGLESVSIEQRAMQPHAPFFKPLDEYILAAEDERQARLDIREFLASARLEARSDDDRTLLLSGYRRGAPQS